jgi:hypothetical protein
LSLEKKNELKKDSVVFPQFLFHPTTPNSARYSGRSNPRKSPARFLRKVFVEAFEVGGSFFARGCMHGRSRNGGRKTRCEVLVVQKVVV